jgi:hypothetical protein
LWAELWAWCTASRRRIGAFVAAAIAVVAVVVVASVDGEGAPDRRIADDLGATTVAPSRSAAPATATSIADRLTEATDGAPPTGTVNPANTADLVATTTQTGPPATPAPPLPGTTNPPLLLDPLVEIRTSVVAIGDSVMLSAAGRMRSFATIDARTSRPPREALARLDVATGQLGFTGLVVLHTGTNGPLPANFRARLDDALGDRQPLVLMTNLAPNRAYVRTNNEIIRALAERPYTTVLDWEALAARCPGACFYSDGIHLRSDGQTYFADLVRTAVAAAEASATTTTTTTTTIDASTTAPPTTASPATTTTTVSRPPTRRVLAITSTGAAVYFPSLQSPPITLFAPSPGAGVAAGGMALAPDLSRAWVALCCDPSDAVRATVPPTPVTLTGPAVGGRRPIVDPNGTLLARAVADAVVAVEPLDASRSPLTAPLDASFVATDVAWVDSTTVAVLGDDASLTEVRWYRIEATRLTLLGSSTVDGGDADATFELAGVRSDGRLAVHQPGDDTVRAYAVGDAVPLVVALPEAALGAWFDRTADLVYVDTDHVVHVGAVTLPGKYDWARVS